MATATARKSDGAKARKNGRPLTTVSSRTRRVKPGELSKRPMRRVWEVPIDNRGEGIEQHLDRYGEPAEGTTEADALKGARTAQRLVKATGGTVHIYFSP